MRLTGILVIALSSFVMRIIGIRYGLNLEITDLSFPLEAHNLSKRNSDLIFYKDKLTKQPKPKITQTYLRRIKYM